VESLQNPLADLARRVTKRRPLQPLIYWVQFVLYLSVLSFPLTVYSGFYREQYGLATQSSPVDLRLISVSPFASGAVAAVYQPA